MELNTKLINEDLIAELGESFRSFLIDPKNVIEIVDQAIAINKQEAEDNAKYKAKCFRDYTKEHNEDLLSSGKYKEYKKYASVKPWRKYYEHTIAYYQYVKEIAEHNEILDNDIMHVVNYVILGKDYEDSKIDNFIKLDGSLIDEIYKPLVFNSFVYYLWREEDLETKIINKLIFIGSFYWIGEADNKTIKDLIAQGEEYIKDLDLNNNERLFNIGIFLSRITGTIRDLEKRSDDYLGSLDAEELKEKIEQIQLPLKYFSSEATMSEGSLINAIAEVPLDLKGARSIGVINNLDVKLSLEAIKQSEDTLNNKLSELDRAVLDIIVFDFYRDQGWERFTNRDVAIQYSQRSGHNNPIDEILEEINKSIEKLQHARIGTGYDILINGNINANRRKNNPLVWLSTTEDNIDGYKVNTYEIKGVPYYLEYTMNKDNGILTATYNREYFYKRIEEKSGSKVKRIIENTSKTQNLKHYLLRRLLFMGDKRIYINVQDIYRIQEINETNFPNYNNLKKARERARNDTKAILKDLKDNYLENNIQYFNFSEDNKGKPIRGYIITPKQDPNTK